MVKPSATTSRRAAVVGIVISLAALLLVNASTPAQAAVATVQGSAYGVFVDATVPVEEHGTYGPDPSVTLPSDGGSSEATDGDGATVVIGPALIFSSGPLTASTSGSIGPGGSVTSSTTIQTVNVTNQEVFTAAQLGSTCTATETTATRKTQITGGTLQVDSGRDLNNDDDYIDEGEHAPVVVAVPETPAPNTLFTGHIHVGNSTDTFRYVFNEQIVNPDGSRTVNAAHQYLDGPLATGNLIIGSSTCGVPPTLAIGDVTLTEGSSGNRIAYFPVTLSRPSASPVTVRYSTGNGTAAAGSDYVAKSGTITIKAGVVNAVASITVKGDTVDESDETFAVNLSAPVAATLGDSVGAGTIRNDDPLSGVHLTIGDVALTEGHSGSRTATLTVSLSSPAASTVTVSYATANVSATQPADYAAKSGTITFTAGTVNKSIAVTVKGETGVEADETFNVVLSNLTGPATLSDNLGVVTLRNDD